MQFRWNRAYSACFLAPMTIILLVWTGCGDGEEPGPELTVAPEALDFGTSVTVGSSGTLDLTLTNSGIGTLNVNGFEWAGTTSPFKVANAERVSLEAGDSVVFTATFTPTGVEEVTATLSISTNSATTGVVPVTFIGKGFSPDSDGDGFSSAQGDCNDSDAAINPDASEICNGKDDDCDSQTDSGADDATVYYNDEDEDGYGDPDTRIPTSSCEPPGAGYASNDVDCDDSNPAVHPDQPEMCDDLEIDDNCDGQSNEGTDGNGDTVPDCYDLDLDGVMGSQGDCNDLDASVYAGAAELPANEIDDDCDGQIDENSPPSVTFVNPEADNAFITPSSVTFAATVHDDYDDPSGLAISFSLENLTANTPAAVLCDAVAPNAEGTVTCTTTLTTGAYLVTVTAIDSEGQATIEIRNLIADYPPTIDIVAPVDGDALTYGVSTTFTIAWADPDDEELTLDNLTWESTLQGTLTPDLLPAPSEPGQLSVNLTLTVPGDHIITAELIDGYGAISTASILVSVAAPVCGTAQVMSLWHMDEGGGSTITDTVNGLVGTLQSTDWATSILDEFSSALSFTGEDGSRVQIDDPADVLSLETFTIDFWFFADGPREGEPVLRQALVYKGEASDYLTTANYYIRVNELGYVVAELTTGSGLNLITLANETTATPILAGNWYYIAVTFDGRFLKVFVEGLEHASADAGSLGVVPLVGQSPVYLGYNPNDASPRPYSLTGLLDDLQVMSCARVASDIQEYYAQRLPHALETPEPEEPESP